MANGSGSKQPENFIEMVKQHKWDFISYLILAVGLFLSFFYPIVGGSLVGIVLGIYFSSSIKAAIQSFLNDIVADGIFRDFIILAGVLALLIATPGLCIATVVFAYIAPYLPKI